MVLEQHIQRVEEKLYLLIKKLHQVEAENISLKAEIKVQQQALHQQQHAIQGLENKLQLMTIASTTQGDMPTAADNEAFKKEIRSKINDYIKEIDRCIALLNS